MKKILSIFIIFLPWPIKIFLLEKFWKYDLSPNAKIGYSYIFPKYLKMDEGSYIGHLNVAIHLDKIIIGENSSIGRLNWITGFPSGTDSKHFAHQITRKSILEIGKETAITKNHHIDCTNQVKIGNYVTIAGYYSQFLTHSINLYENRQDSSPIEIGDYCFVSTNCVILGGSKLPSYSVLGAKALLNKAYTEEYMLYGGVPSKTVAKIPKESKYFKREKGFVY